MNNKYFSKRRTIREYSAQEVPTDLIVGMLNDAMRAPTTGNMQLYSAILTSDNAIKRELIPLHFNQPQIMSAPVVVTICADFNRFVKWCENSNANPGYDNLQSFITAALDATIFAQQFNTIAEMSGLGCCYLGTTTYNAKEIANVLNLPKRVIPLITLTVGYPKNESGQVERLPVEGIVHLEKYDDYTPERINNIYCEKEQLDINQKYVEENNLETLAQVFTNVRYTKANNELFSEKFFDFIKEQGFKIPF